MSSLLDRFGVDLTAQARAGELDAVVGREDEIRQLADILSRRRQNNPILVGEAGVGKTAVVEGFALAVAQREVPRHLEQVRVLALDLGLLQAGATLEGEFEERLAGVLDEVREAEVRTILFLDEVHMLIGAGGAAGTGDAANLLKPALARGEVSIIAATTWREYKVHIEPDPALTRRFQAVIVDEPRRPAALAMLRRVARTLEAHHDVEIRDEAVVEAVDLSTRYVTGRRLPDKAISLLDTAAANVRIARSSTPAAVERAARELTWLDAERVALERDLDRSGGDPTIAATLEALQDRAREAERTLERLEAAWQRQRGLVRRISAARDELHRGDRNSPGDKEKGASGAAPHVRRKLEDLERQLADAQGETRMVPVDVDRFAVAEVVERWTGIPVGRQLTDDARVLADLERRLAEHVVGQAPALSQLGRRLRSARAGLDGPERPMGVFLLVGPHGTGKTHTARALASLLYGGTENLIALDMAEYREAHTLSKLRGAPPGYVGHGRGGVLTEALRRRPYSVVLLDDVDRAHPDVLAALIPAFDRGRMEDGEGTVVDVSHALILMTTSADEASLPARLGRGLLQRTTAVTYRPLDGDALDEMLGRELRDLGDRIAARHGVALELPTARFEALSARARAAGDLGGRAVLRLVRDEVVPAVSSALLEQDRGRTEAGGDGGPPKLSVDVRDGNVVADWL